MYVRFPDPVFSLTINSSVQGADVAFPRPQIIRGLLHAMRTLPKLSKESSTALIDLSQAISQNPTNEETALLLDSTLVQEAYARNASLQALQVIVLPMKFITSLNPKSDSTSLLISRSLTGHRSF